MDTRYSSDSTQTVLDLALQLGVRVETVLRAMQEMGMGVEDINSSIDPDLAPEIVNRMVSEGTVSSALKKSKNWRKHSDEPVVDDELVKEALGASESGFSPARIPRQIMLESGLEEPSFFQRWFGGKQKEIVRSLKEQEFDENTLQSMFTSRSSEARIASASPFAEDIPEVEEEDFIEPLSETVEEEEAFDEELAGIEVDEDILNDLNDLELTGGGMGEALTNEDYEDLEGLEELDLSSDDLEGIDDLDLEGTGLEDSDEDLGDLDIEGEKLPPAVDEEELAPGFLERVFERINLTNAEMWGLMGGATALMVVLLTVTIIWWLNYSPKSAFDLFKKAEDHYRTAVEYQEDLITKGIRSWDAVQAEYKLAADNYEAYINKYSNRFQDAPDLKQNILDSFRRLTESYHRIATGNETYDPSKMDEPYRRSIQLYEQYLEYINKLANQNIDANTNRALIFPDVAEQREAQYRIAMANRKLKNFEVAEMKFRQFVNDYRSTSDAVRAQMALGENYEDWAKVDNELRPKLLGDAITAYEYALKLPNSSDNLRRMEIYLKLGDVKHQQYQIARSTNRPEEEANQHLNEAMAYYEFAEQEVRQAERIEFNQKVQVFTKLADLYMQKGRESGKRWRDNHQLGSLFNDSIAHKQTLLDQAEQERKSTEMFSGKAKALYDELLENPVLSTEPEYKPHLYNILYNIAYSQFILQNYPAALAAGAQLVSASEGRTDTEKARIHYLLGNTAWEHAEETQDSDYSLVKEHYRKALELDDFYTREDKGETSHLADLRLTNVYYMLEHNYVDALRRFESALTKYPDTGISYLSLYYYGKALDEYGYALMAEADQMELNAQSLDGTIPKLPEAEELRKKAKEQFISAVDIYERAINARKNSTHIDSPHETFLIEILFNKGFSAYNAGKLKDAEKYLTEAFNRYKENEIALQRFIPAAIETLGDLNSDLANYPEAVKWYSKYLGDYYEDTNARVTMKLAKGYLNQFSYEKGRGILERIIQHYPLPSEKEIAQHQRQNYQIPKGPGFEALKLIAESYVQQAAQNSGERNQYLQKALDTYKRISRHYPLNSNGSNLPDDLDTMIRIGDIEYELGNYGEAARNYEALIQNQPNYARKGLIFHRIGESYSQQGQWDNAVTALSNIDRASMDNDVQYADTQLLTGHALEMRANQYLEADQDEDLYVRYLEKAQQAYDLAARLNAPQKSQEALARLRTIQAILESRRIAQAPTTFPQ